MVPFMQISHLLHKYTTVTYFYVDAEGAVGAAVDQTDTLIDVERRRRTRPRVPPLSL